jgi:hypothetical protein
VLAIKAPTPAPHGEEINFRLRTYCLGAIPDDPWSRCAGQRACPGRLRAGQYVGVGRRGHAGFQTHEAKVRGSQQVLGGALEAIRSATGCVFALPDAAVPPLGIVSTLISQRQFIEGRLVASFPITILWQVKLLVLVILDAGAVFGRPSRSVLDRGRAVPWRQSIEPHARLPPTDAGSSVRLLLPSYCYCALP